MSKIAPLITILCCGLWGALGLSADAPAPAYHLIKTIPLKGDGGWDYLTFDPDSRRLFIARSNRVVVVDVDKESVAGEIPNTAGVHGVALAPKLNRGFASCGGDATVCVFDLKTLAETGRVKVGKRPDAILFDPASDRVISFNASGSASVIDPEKLEVTATIELGGKPEFGAADGKGKVFVNLENKHEIAVLDVQKGTALEQWPIAPGEEPSGLAIDRTGERLFATCGNEKMVCVDAKSGKVLGSAPIGKGTDACVYDPESKLAFSSNRDGTLTVVRPASDGALEVAQTVATQAGARTMALDPKTHHILLVTAKAKPGERRAFEPDSFVLLVVGQ